MPTPGTMTLLELRTAARERSDMVSSLFVTDAEFNSYINQSYYGLYDLLIQTYGNDYFVGTPFAITTDGTNFLYSLPTDFYKLLGVDFYTNTNINPWTTLKPFNFAERNKFQIPSSGRRLQLWYAPRLTALALDTDIADGVSGWTEYIIVEAAIKAKDKEESDVTVLVAERNDMKQRIESAAENRDAGNPQTVNDVYANSAYLNCSPNLSYRLNGNSIWLGEYQVDPLGGYGAF